MFLKYANNLGTQLVSWLIILLVTINYFHIASFLDNEILSVVTVALIIGQIENRYRFFSLDRPVFDFLGKISYGIYVVHPLLTFFLSKVFFNVFLTNSFLDYVFVYVLVFACTIFLAFISYEILEKPFLARKTSYTTIASSNIKPRPVDRS